MSAIDRETPLYPADVAAYIKTKYKKHDVKMFAYRHGFKLILLSAMFILSMFIDVIRILFF